MDKKTFVIVGAGKGLGNAVAKEFANHDFRVVLIARNINHLAKDPKFGEKNGTVIFTGGGFAKTFSTIPFLKPLCIDKAAMNAACIVLHDTLKDKGIFVGSILVSGVIDPQDERYAPNLIAKEYWKMYETKSEYQVQY